MSIDDRIATPDGKRRYVRGLFATIADRYDLITVVLSYGQDRRWKRRLVGLADLTSGTKVLDLATGTGDIAFECAACGASVTGLDVTQRMVEIASGKAAVPTPGVGSVAAAPRFVVGDMMALPFASGCFDVVTTG